MVENDPLIGGLYYERFRPQAAEALQQLRMVSFLVEPIMRRREFKIGTLAEFWPEDEGLRGENEDQGKMIFIRLRSARDQRAFLHMNELVTCLLHELCHNIHYNHTKYFWQLFYLLQDEYVLLDRNDYTGMPPGHNPYPKGSPRTEQEVQRHDRAAAEETTAHAYESGTELERQISTMTETSEGSFQDEATLMAQLDLIIQQKKEIHGDTLPGSRGTWADRNATSTPLQHNNGSWLRKIRTLINPKNYLCCNSERETVK